MITMFTIPRSFEGDRDYIQRNAIMSWARLDTEIYFVGRDPGVESVAKEFGAISLPVDRIGGIPLVSDAFKRVIEHTDNDILHFTNSDCIYFDNLESSVERVEQAFSEFLIVAQRWDLWIKGYIDYSKDWDKMLIEAVKKHGRLHQPVGIDCFIFRGDFFNEVPPFAIGRTAWDNWLVWKGVNAGVPVVDATADITLVHQEHGRGDKRKSKIAQRNRAILAQYANRIYGVNDANWRLVNGELIAK